jgi:hypothetical protein
VNLNTGVILHDVRFGASLESDPQPELKELAPERREKEI